MSYSWGKPEDVLAQRFSNKEIPGLFSKYIELKNSEVGLVERGGEILTEYGEGKHEVSEAFKSGTSGLVLVDTAPKHIRETVPELLTEDDNKVGADLDFEFKIFYPEKFLRNLFAHKNVFTTGELYTDIYNELLSKVLMPEVRKRKIGDLYGNRDILEEIRAAFEMEMKKTLESWGLELLALSIIWNFPEDYEQYMKERSSLAKESEEKEIVHEEALKDAEREKELEAVEPSEEKSTEEVKSDLEKEALRKEVEIELERKQSKLDAEEALDALSLKDLMKKQKSLKEKEDEE